MKKVFILLSASLISLQSCNSYKKVNYDDFETGKTYIIKMYDKELKAKLNQVTDTTIVVTHKNKEVIIQKKEIQVLRKRKF